MKSNNDDSFDPPSAWVGAARKLQLIDHCCLFTKLIEQEVGALKWITLLPPSQSASRGLEACLRLQPDVALIEAFLPDAPGIDLAAELTRRCPATRTILLTGTLTEFLTYKIARSGITGLVWKTPGWPDELKLGIKAVLLGGTFFPAEFVRAKRELWARPDAFFKVFSDADLSLLSLLGQGCSDAEIGRRLGLTLSTVQTYRRRFLRQLGIRHGHDLFSYVTRIGLVPPAPLPAAPCELADELRLTADLRRTQPQKSPEQSSSPGAANFPVLAR